jgi:hypothetical protein
VFRLLPSRFAGPLLQAGEQHRPGGQLQHRPEARSADGNPSPTAIAFSPFISPCLAGSCRSSRACSCRENTRINRCRRSRAALPGGAGYSVLTRWLGPGPLPPPEWWNPALADGICFPDWNLLAGYRRAITETPRLNAAQRLKCYAMLGEWVMRYWPKLAQDVAFAAEALMRRATAAARAAVTAAAAATTPARLQSRRGE